MCEFIDEIIGKYIALRLDIPNEIKEEVKRKSINAYMEKAQDNPDDFAHKTLVEIVDDIMKEIKEKYKDITEINVTAATAGGSRRRRRHRRSTRTSKKGKKYSTTRRRK